MGFMACGSRFPPVLIAQSVGLSGVWLQERSPFQGVIRSMRTVSPRRDSQEKPMIDQWNSNRTPTPARGSDSEGENHGGDGKRRRDHAQKEKLDDALDRGLEDSFPGSDPVSVTQPPSNPYDKVKR
jgi:hypothetical protein